MQILHLDVIHLLLLFPYEMYMVVTVFAELCVYAFRSFLQLNESSIVRKGPTWTIIFFQFLFYLFVREIFATGNRMYQSPRRILRSLLRRNHMSIQQYPLPTPSSTELILARTNKAVQNLLMNLASLKERRS